MRKRRATVLRDHQVVFLLGAGASKPAGMPTTLEFVSEFAEKIKESDLAATFGGVVNAVVDWTYKTGRQLDIEVLYEVLVRLSTEGDDPFVDAFDLKALHLTRENCTKLRRALEAFIQARVFADPARIEYLRPLLGFVPADGPLEIFTTNYDTCIELLCHTRRLRWEDGFGLYWSPRTFRGRGVEVALHKLHGSVLWYVDDSGGYVRSPLRVPTSGNDTLRTFAGTCRPLLIYPARKASHEAPYADNLAILRRLLIEDGARVFLVVIGYSFRDEHLRQLVRDALARNRHLRLILIDPRAEKIYRETLAGADGDSAAEMIGSVQVMRISAPMDESILKRLRVDILPALDRLATEESDLSLGSSPSRDNLRTLAKGFRAIGDFPSFYRLAHEAYWVGVDNPDAVVWLLRDLVAEVSYLAGSGVKPPKGRSYKVMIEALRERVGSGLEARLHAPGEVTIVLTGFDDSSIDGDLRSAANDLMYLQGFINEREPRRRTVERLVAILGEFQGWLNRLRAPAGSGGTPLASEKLSTQWLHARNAAAVEGTALVDRIEAVIGECSVEMRPGFPW